MAISAINNNTVDSATKAAGLSMDDLMKVLLTDLNYQDPLKPVDNKDFLAQMAQFSALDATRQLNDSLQSLLSTQSMNQSVGLLGKSVDIQQDDGNLLKGTVTAVSLSTGVPLVTVTTGDQKIYPGIGISQIQTIR